MRINAMHRKQKGSIGHLAVMLDLSKQGLPVFTEYSDNSKTDIITIVDNVPIRIQVKARQVRNGAANIETVKSAKGYNYRYSEEDFDVLAVYVVDTGQIAYMSIKEFLSVDTAISLRVEPLRKISPTSRLIEDYADFYASVD